VAAPADALTMRRMPDLIAPPTADLQRVIEALPALEAAEDPARHRGLLEQAAALAAGDGIDAHTLGRIQLLMARLHAQLGEYELAYARALSASEQLARAGDTARASSAASTCISICIETGDFSRALEHLRQTQAAARASGDMELLVRLLFNQACTFLCVDEFDAAAHCCEEVLKVVAEMPPEATRGQVATTAESARAALGFSRTYLADAHERRGRLAEAKSERRRAAAVLPKANERSPLASLHMVIYARSRLGDLEGARHTASIFLRRVRQLPRAPRWMAQVWLTMGVYYQHAGKPGRAAARFERAISAMRSIRHDGELPNTMQMLANAHASNGRHADALRWLRQAHAARRHTQPEQERLHYRMAALERDAEERRLERETAMLHAQRLAVVGRLMAQIYHSLGAPLVAARQALSLCITQADHLTPAELSAAMRGVVAHIDEATALTRQLRMFSYRAAPQAMVLDLPLALQEAWNGMAIGRSGPREPLVLRGVAPPQVRSDAQRLAVLLRILLIEIERLGGAQAPQVLLSMNGPAVRVLFASPAREADASAVGGVGFTLCEEIAREMQGGLWRMDAPAGELRVALELPAER